MDTKCRSTATGSALTCTAASPAAAAARNGACRSLTSGATRATHRRSDALPALAGCSALDALSGSVPPPWPESTYSANSKTPVLARGALEASSDANSAGRIASAGCWSPTAASAALAKPRTVSLASTSRGNKGGHSFSSSGSREAPHTGIASTMASSTACATLWCGSPTCCTNTSAKSLALDDASETQRLPPARSADARLSNAAVFASHVADGVLRPELDNGEPRAPRPNTQSSAALTVIGRWGGAGGEGERAFA